MGSGVRVGKPAPGSVAPLEYRPGRGYDQRKWCWLLCDRPLTEIRESTLWNRSCSPTSTPRGSARPGP